MIIYKCDRCGTEIKEEEKSIGVQLVEAFNQAVKTLTGEQKAHDLVLYDIKENPRRMDLCAECKEDLYTWFVKKEEQKGGAK